VHRTEDSAGENTILMG